ncbi:MAG: tRNA uridine-5-carboxymethylaminomethyl(34) synthesis GTPase MnmE [Muribaculaceae bacterium]
MGTQYTSAINAIATQDNTICAISTPHGTGGIAVIRISGPQATNIVSQCWKGSPIANMASHTAHLGQILFADNQPLDQVVFTLFRAPKSFTGEDVIEISCHGSRWIQQQLVNRLIECGCQAASAGEFTQRAFANHRIDLSQAEAIADLIAASSRAAHRIAINQMRGAFSQQLSQLREQLLNFVSLIELELDFSEEEVQFADRTQLLALAQQILSIITRLANSYATGNVIKNGLPVAIAGETNAGKSTLLNYLLNDDRALVSDIHGTTRDVIEDTITINGTLFRFIDTAGIRHTDDTIEAMGIERTYKKISQAQLVLWLIDGTNPPQHIAQLSTQILPHTNGKQLIAVVNKDDQLTPQQRQEIVQTLQQVLPTNTAHIFISAKQQTGLSQLQQLLTQAAALPEADENQVIVTNARHYQALTEAGKALERAIDGLQQGISGDFVSQDIRETMHYLGEITGEITTHEILGNIFSRFCIGK